MTTVAILKKRDGTIVSVYGSPERARATCARYNADPFNEDGAPDADAPYVVEVWAIHESQEGE